MTRSKYFKNKWNEYNAISSDKFEPIEFELFMDWRGENWELKRSYSHVIRATDHNNNKVKEYAYKRKHAAEKRFKQLMTEDNVSITICSHDAVHHLHPKEFINHD